MLFCSADSDSWDKAINQLEERQRKKESRPAREEQRQTKVLEDEEKEEKKEKRDEEKNIGGQRCWRTKHSMILLPSLTRFSGFFQSDKLPVVSKKKCTSLDWDFEKTKNVIKLDFSFFEIGKAILNFAWSYFIKFASFKSFEENS